MVVHGVFNAGANEDEDAVETNIPEAQHLYYNTTLAIYYALAFRMLPRDEIAPSLSDSFLSFLFTCSLD